MVPPHNCCYDEKKIQIVPNAAAITASGAVTGNGKTEETYTGDGSHLADGGFQFQGKLSTYNSEMLSSEPTRPI